MDRAVLVVDDDPQFLDMMKTILEENGYQPLLADRGPAALEVLRQRRPDAVVLDLGLPEQSGWQVFDAIRSSPITRDVPVILASDAGIDLSRVREWLAKRGQEALVLVRPFEIDELTRKLGEVIVAGPGGRHGA